MFKKLAKQYENILGYSRRIRDNLRKGRSNNPNKTAYSSRAAEYAKDQARAIIADLQNKGYMVSGKFADMFKPDKGRRYSTTQAKAIIEKARPENILEHAYIEHIIPQPGQAEPVKIKLRLGREMQDLSSKYFSGLKRALKETPSRSLAHFALLNIKRLEKELGTHILVGTKGLSDQEIYRNLAKHLPSQGYAERVFSKVPYEEAGKPGSQQFLIDQTFKQALQYFSDKGALTEAGRREKQISQQMQARGLARDNAERLIDFFKFSTQWQKYREKLGRSSAKSEEAVNAIDEALEYVTDMNERNSIPILDMEMSKGGDIDDIIERYLEWIMESIQ